jgi:hypothetical protein
MVEQAVGVRAEQRLDIGGSLGKSCDGTHDASSRQITTHIIARHAAAVNAPVSTMLGMGRWL